MNTDTRPPAARLCLLLAGLGACGGAQHDTPRSSDAGVADASATESSASDASGDVASDGGSGSLTLLTEPDQGMTPVYTFVSSAKKTIDMTMYELTDTMMTGLLTTAAKNGVVVRVILDQNLEKADNTPAFTALAAGNVQVHWADTTYSATHQKTITVDQTTSAIMSLNLASEDYSTSRDFAVITSNAADVAAIETTFNADFASTPITPPTGTDLVWSPTNAKAVILGLLDNAKTSLLIENEEMSDTDVVSALENSALRGVDVKIAMEGSTEWDANFTAMAGFGAKIATYRHSSLYIHAKVIIADFGTPAVSAFVGSVNFSEASLSYNRELGIVTTDAAILTSLNTTLSSDFAEGTTYP